MNRRFISRLVIFGGLATTALIYQNCAAPLESQNSENILGPLGTGQGVVGPKEASFMGSQDQELEFTIPHYFLEPTLTSRKLRVATLPANGVLQTSSHATLKIGDETSENFIFVSAAGFVGSTSFQVLEIDASGSRGQVQRTISLAITEAARHMTLPAQSATADVLPKTMTWGQATSAILNSSTLANPQFNPQGEAVESLKFKVETVGPLSCTEIRCTQQIGGKTTSIELQANHEIQVSGDDVSNHSLTINMYAVGSSQRAYPFTLNLTIQIAGVTPKSPIPVTPAITTIVTGHLATEGPLWIPEANSLLFSDTQAQETKLWNGASGNVSLFKNNASKGNGNARLAGNFIVEAEGKPNRRLVKINLDTKQLTPIVSLVNGKKLNSPNDVAVFTDGSIYFTDRYPGTLPDPDAEISHNAVYRVGADKVAVLMSNSFTSPNGITFSPDFTRLYVSDNITDKITVFDVNASGALSNSRVFYQAATNPRLIELGITVHRLDGITTDDEGNVYTSGSNGVTVIAPDGKIWGYLAMGETTTNVTFGGSDRKTLFVTGGSKVKRVNLLIPGRQ